MIFTDTLVGHPAVQGDHIEIELLEDVVAPDGADSVIAGIGLGIALGALLILIVSGT